MAKKIKIPSFLLFATACILLTAGWLMAPFPFLIFVALAPLFALADRTDAKGPVWEKMEYVLLALGISFLVHAIFHERSIVGSLASAIVLTVAFVAHAWVGQILGVRSGKITIILFWLSVEYLLLKVNPDNGVFLADILRIQPAWTRWNVQTGYLGSSLWILIVNWVMYQTFLTVGEIRWVRFLVAMLLLLGPILYSYQLSNSPITHQEMVNLYAQTPSGSDVGYLANGEFIVRTAAWISTLILLFTFVKSQTTKR